jgi:hypothetical protein
VALKVCLITVPGSGTRSVAQTFGFAEKHLYPDIYKRALQEKPLVISTWRDPLKICATNSLKPSIKGVQPHQMMGWFERFQKLRSQLNVIIVDMRCISLKVGENQHYPKHNKNQPTDFRDAVKDKNIEYIQTHWPGLLNDLRKFDWKDLWTEDWWR